jgi:hypothetical protein
VSVGSGPILHVGIAVPGDRVVHASGRVGRVVIEDVGTFSRGRRVYWRGYPGALPRDLVVERALALVGQPYDVFGLNCEHLAELAHGRPAKSPQLRLGAVALGALAAAWWLWRPR